MHSAAVLEPDRTERRLRILQLIPTLVVGGAERMVAALSIHLRRWGHTVAVVSMYPPFGTWIEKDLQAESVPITFLGKRSGPDLRVVPRIRRAIAEFRPDVLHTHLYVLKYALPALLTTRRCPVVHTIHNLADKEVDRPSMMLQYLAFRAGVTPVAIGRSVAESIRRCYGLQPAHVIPNGVPAEHFSPPRGARDEVRASLGLKYDAPVFVSVGKLEPQKNHHGLLLAFASDRLARIGAHLLLVGDGFLRRDLEARARALACGDRVHFLGVRSDVPRVLAAADAFVLASHYEGNPLSVMEAMAAGKAVVATAVGCVPELVADESGQLVPPGDVPALEAALFEIAQDLRRAQVMGAAGGRIAAARFDDVLMARAYEQLYRERA